MTRPESAETLLGAVLNKRFRLQAVLGEGGLASVYRGEPVDGSQPVAIKVLKPEFRGDKEVVDRFLSEAALTERIDHPGVVRALGAFRAEDGTPYLATELLDGYALTVPMNRGRTPVEKAVQLELSLLDALSAAHKVGIVHRDLKPDNVFVEPGEELRVRLLDFGISRAVEAAGGSARKTKTGMLLGTPGYMSPEQVRNSKDADHRSDLFSAGVLFYELLTGQRAFNGSTEYERMMAVLFADASPIEQAAPQFAHWGPFFAKALHRDAAQRFQSAEEMGKVLSLVAKEGRMPNTKFGGDATAISPAGDRQVSDPVPPPDVRIVDTPPRRVELSWVLLAVLVALVFGFVLGYLTGSA